MMQLAPTIGFCRWAIRCRVVTTLLVAVLLSHAAGAIAAGDWPEFRGPSGNGVVTAPGADTPVGLATHWSETEHVRWKTAIPYRGWSSPIVLGNDIWLTTATEDGHDFYAVCVDLETGVIRVNEKIFHSDNPEPLGNEVNGYASPTPVIIPGRVFVHFGSYGTACLDTATGNVLWKREDLPCRHYRGPGSSIILVEGMLILTFDGVDQQYVTALDAATGATVWRTDRSTAWTDLDETGKPKREGDFRKAFSTPLLVDAGGEPQIISVGSAAAFAYAPHSGEEIWTVRLPGYTPATRPVFGKGLAYITSGRGNSQLLAIRVDGHGDVTDSHVAWRYEGPELPQEPSPVLMDDLLFMVNNRGVATCFDAATGAIVWSERIGGNFVASPILADGLLYLCSTQGKTTILRAGRSFEEVATNTLDGGFMASPAVAGKAMILRTETHLYRIEEP